MNSNNVLYSVNTLLAYNINQEHYKELHYVWCCPYFSAKSRSHFEANVPRSSTPSAIYEELFEDVKTRDKHSAKIKENRIGLLKGAVAKFNQGVIDEKTKDRIIAMVNHAEIGDFLPLIYVIPFSKVESIIEDVPIEEKASVLSPEVKITELPRDCFDIMEFGFK